MLLLYGGNGFLGSHIAAHAVKQGISVAAVGTREEAGDRLPDGVAYAKRGTAEADDFLTEANTIVYLAHASKPARHGDGLSYELETNTRATADFIHDLAVKGFDGQVFYTSSGGQVYGANGRSPARETDPLRPRTAYGMGKLLCEEVIRYGERVHDLNAAVLRVANPVGIGQIGTGHGLLGAIFKALRDDVPISLFGDGDNTRDYFDVDDLSAMLVRLHSKAWRGHGVFNIGSGVGHTERDVLKLVRDVVGRAPEILFKDARAFDLPYAVVDPSKAEAQLGWEVTRDMRAIIADMAAQSLSLAAAAPAEAVTAPAPAPAGRS